MIFENIFKVLSLFAIIYFFYKLDWHRKIYKKINQGLGITNNYKKSQKEKKKYIKFFKEQGKNNGEI